MKIISEGDGRVVKIIRIGSDEAEGALRLSGFVFPFEKEGTVLLKHTLTKQVLRLSAEEWDALKNGTLPAGIRDELVKYRFLVEEDHNEVSQYLLVRSILRTMEKKEPGIDTYTILPTTGCNARCVYCYEEGWQSKTMSPETADAATDFILRTKRDGEIRLSWFGGEPLCGAGLISRICGRLRDAGVTYASTMITNGTLMTPELAREAKELWNLKRVQLSMDGARADYAVRKNYARPDLYNYDTAMNAAKLLSDAGIRVSIRCNYDSGNLDGVKEFLDDCRDLFGERGNVSVYLEQLFESADAEKNAALFLKAEKAAAYADELGLSYMERTEPRLKTHYCMADYPGEAVIIDPEGGLHVCEHDINGKPIGTVFGGPVAWPENRTEIAEECRSCCFLPECTPFRKNSCILEIAACRTQREVWTRRSLTGLLRRLAEDAKGTEEEAEPETASFC